MRLSNNPDLKRAEQELASLRAQLADMEQSMDALGNGNLQIPNLQLPSVELDYRRRARHVKYHESVYEFLAKELEAAPIDESKEAVTVQVVDKAVRPEKKSSPPRAVILFVTAILVFLVCCASILFLELLRLREQDPQERARMALLRHSLWFFPRSS